jgi:hypothetical protein
MSALAADPQIVSQNELQELQQRHDSYRFEAGVWSKALVRAGASRRWSPNSGIVAGIVTSASCICFVTLAAISLCLLPTALLRYSPMEASRLGAIRQAFAWCFVCSASFVVLGMLPSGFISRPAQTWAITVLLWSIVAAVFAFVLFVAHRLLRRRDYQISLRGTFGLTTAVAILVFIWPVLSDLFNGLAAYPPEQLLPARAWHGIDGEAVRMHAGINSGSWTWVMVQWSLYSGPLRTAFAAIALIAVWFARRSALQSGEHLFNYWTSNIFTRWTTLARYVAKSAAGAAAVGLLLYLLVAPTVIRTVEDEFQYRMRYARNPAEHMERIAAARAEILATPSEVEAIRQQLGQSKTQ